MQTWAVIGKDSCPWCDKVKSLLEENNIPFAYFNLDADGSLKDFIKITGHKTVPQVFAGGKHIGGYEDTQRYIKELNETPN